MMQKQSSKEKFYIQYFKTETNSGNLPNYDVLKNVETFVIEQIVSVFCSKSHCTKDAFIPGSIFSQGCIEVDFDPRKYIGEPLQVVVVTYLTGDSFGSCSGNKIVPEICINPKKAHAIVKMIKAGSYRKKTGKYAPWDGYFEVLEEVIVQSMILQEAE